MKFLKGAIFILILCMVLGVTSVLAKSDSNLQKDTADGAAILAPSNATATSENIKAP